MKSGRLTLLLVRQLFIGKMRHGFVGTTSSHQHHKVDDTSAFAYSVVVPKVLSKVHFQAGIVVISIGGMIKGIVRVFFGRSNTAGFQVSRYRLLFDGLNVVISWFHKVDRMK